MALDWTDERYLRLYVRDTPHWLLGPWEARAVLAPVMRKLDRAGTLDLGDDGLEALAAVVGLPLEVVEPGMGWWLRKGTFELVAGQLVMPKFLDAQESKASDAQRAREHRARVRDLARAGAVTVTKNDGTDTTRDANITPRDGTVTRGHTESHAVTLNHAVPCRDVPPVPPVPSHAEPNGEAPSALRLAPVPANGTSRSRKKPTTAAPPSDAPPETVEAWFAKHKIPSADPEALKFLNHHRKKGNCFADWPAAWWTWKENAPEFARPTRNTGHQPQHANGPAWDADDGSGGST
jgi:hypothetical protein